MIIVLQKCNFDKQTKKCHALLGIFTKFKSVGFKKSPHASTLYGLNSFGGFVLFWLVGFDFVFVCCCHCFCLSETKRGPALARLED